LTKLQAQLRERVHEQILPALAHGLLRTQGLAAPTHEQLRATYQRALSILFRVLFCAYANTPVERRSLGVREFGTLFEGLLEQELNVGPDGDVYLTASSRLRKQTGAYFSKAFVVDHLLDTALEPALASHVQRLASMSDRDAAAALFDFKVADLAMGAGHFLVAAIDRIERRLAEFLVRRPLPGIRRELLRHEIVQSCIYGVDLNPAAVELARLSIGVHAVVPGQPPPVLHEHLVVGNALVGIGSMAEAEELLRTHGGTLSQCPTALFDVLTANRIAPGFIERLEPLAPLHLPLAFPAVFGRARAGFDVILGNPPWEEPGDEAYRRALVAGGFPGMGTGDPDTYKAFTWRFCQTVAEHGIVGVVLPVAAFNAKGSSEWRRALLGAWHFRDLTFLTNTRSWVFDDVHAQYTVALATFSPSAPGPAPTIPLRGPYASMARYREGLARPACKVPLAAILDGTDTAAFPLLPGEQSLEIWLQMRKAPRLDLDDGKSWRARPYRELDATNDKSLMTFGQCPARGWWPVYKGESFDIWQCDTGSHYAWVEPTKIQSTLQQRRLRTHKHDSPLGEFSAQWREDPNTLPCLAPRIAFRDVSRATDSRTIRAALLPGSLVVANQAPYLLWPRGDASDQAFLLGVLCSLPLDWYARRFVDKHVNYHVFNPLPIPRPDRDRRWTRVVALAGRLAAHDRRLRAWARAVGVECGSLAADEQTDMIAELDAVVAHLYGLTEQQLVHIFATFHRGWDFTDRLAITRRHFRAWARRAS
jgi:hypothetical protein